jgi:anti-sigma B factor antagonist
VPVPDNGLSVDVERLDGTVLIHVSGDLDVAAVPRLEQGLSEAEENAEAVIVDLRRLRFIDSAGLRCLLQAGTRAHRNGHRLCVRRGPYAVHRVFELTRAERVLDFID